MTNRGYFTFGNIEDETGYTIHRLRRAAVFLKITPPGRKNVRYRFDDSQKAQLVDFLKNFPDGRNIKMHGALPGQWNVGGRPPHCLECHRDSVPHFVRGVCKTCYSNRYTRLRQQRLAA